MWSVAQKFANDSKWCKKEKKIPTIIPSKYFLELMISSFKFWDPWASIKITLKYYIMCENFTHMHIYNHHASPSAFSHPDNQP